MNGDIACAEGALAAGCDFFGGYPITPSTEVAERLAQRLPEVGGTYIQMEDELGSISAVLGAAWGGARAMTATSGPGFSLMMESLGFAVMTETPCVIVDVQRGSPSTGLPTLVGQSDVMQARWGSHGDNQIVAYSPASCQEMFEVTIKAFNTADTFRVPVVILADEVVGHMTERVTVPGPEDIEFTGRKQPRDRGNGDGRLLSEPELVPPMPSVAEGHRIHVTGLTHDELGYPATDAAAHDRLVRRLNAKVERHAGQIVEYEEVGLDDAEIVVIAYGCVSRSARQAVREARANGVRAGLLRPITLWPFPEARIQELNDQVKGFIVAELNLGQVARETERFTSKRVGRVNHAGGMLLPPEPIAAAIEEAQSW
jgi:2-oxoglutarate/2-oxoacid ferredoxin oxidoreductase subunit alpha